MALSLLLMDQAIVRNGDWLGWPVRGWPLGLATSWGTISVCLLCVAGSAGGADKAPAFQPADLFRLEGASDPQISPDGSFIAYVRRSPDIMEDRWQPSIWISDTRSGRETPIAAGPGVHAQPRWSNDSRRLAFVSTSEGRPARILVWSRDTRRSSTIAELTEAPGNLSWSPDGSLIAYSALVPDPPPSIGRLPPKPAGANWAPPLQVYDRIVYRTDDQGYRKPGFFHLFLLPSSGGAVRQLTSGPFNHGGPLSWTPDGRRILFSANRRRDWQFAGRELDIHSANTDSGEVVPLVTRDGPDAQPAVSPDGRWVAFTGFDEDDKPYHSTQLYLVSTSGGPIRSLTGALDRPVQDPVWASDGRSVYVSYDDRAARKIARVSLGGSIKELFGGLAGPMIDRPYVGGSFSVARDGLIAAMTGSSGRPASISLVTKGKARQVSGVNAFLGGRRLGEVRKIIVRSPDGLSIDAWMTLPPGYVGGTRMPLVLEIHGGPHLAYGPYFSFDNQLLASAGFAVMSVNPRGSTSYGDVFANGISRAYPGKDFDDLMSAVDAAIAAGYADPNRLFVMGGSGGGILTAWVIGRTGRFRAAAVQRPAVNFTSFVLTADQPNYYPRYWFDGMPWDDIGQYWSRSPLSQAGKMRTPSLIIVGDRDFRTPASEAEQLYTALKLQDVPAVLIRVPGASHFGIVARPSHVAARMSAIVDWFRRFDGPGRQRGEGGPEAPRR